MVQICFFFVYRLTVHILYFSYQFPGIIVSNLTKLEAAIANISSKKDQIEVQVKMLSCISYRTGQKNLLT